MHCSMDVIDRSADVGPHAAASIAMHGIASTSVRLAASCIICARSEFDDVVR